jgi:ribosomal protein S18 acetylase RimI-like enzyme
MNLRVRPIELRPEAERLSTLLGAGLAATLEALGEEPRAGLAERFLEHDLGKPEALFLVAEGPTGTVGLLVTAPFADPATGESAPLVTALYVVPEFRHRGIARALFAEGKRLLHQRGKSRLLARAAHNDDVLISMGERWGLVRTWELMA